ncbi:MAG: TIGR04255 family protein [Flavobacterium sp.]
MKIPKSIHPDRIKDAIVEISFESDFPNEINLGIFFNVLNQHYKYTNKPLGTQQLSANNFNFNKEITLSLGGVSLFYNDKIKFQISNNSIAFNCLAGYILWENYSKEIYAVLELMINTSVIKSFKRVGVRYISEYSNIDLRDVVKFSFSFGFPEVKSDAFSFNSEFDFKDYRVLLNLNNNVKVHQEDEIIPTSVIDIDIIKQDFIITNIKELWHVVENAHQNEKEIFFRLLKEEYLETLEPKY